MSVYTVYIWAEFVMDQPKEKLNDLTEREGLPYLACNERNAFFTSEHQNRYKLSGRIKICVKPHYIF